MTTPGLRVDQVADAFVSVPGVTLEMLTKTAGSQTVTSATFVDLTDISETFVAPVAGTYVVTLVVRNLFSNSSDLGRFRAVFDAAGTPQYVGGDDKYSTLYANSAARWGGDIVGSVSLAAGSHTVKVQALMNTGVSVETDATTTFRVFGTLVSGSGAGGVIVSRASATAQTVSSTEPSYADVSGLSITVTTAANEQVLLALSACALYASGIAWSYVRFVIDGAAVPPTSQYGADSSGYGDPIGLTVFSPALTAGSHTFKVQGAKVTNNWTMNNAEFQVVQFRGGLTSVDTKRPTITYNAAGAIDVAAAPGEPSTVKLTLQDGKQRWFSGTLAWAFATGVGDLGLDTGTEASSTWYYMYAVPSSADDGKLSVRASVTGPATGPTGYTNFKYLGAFRNDGSSNIIKFYQVGSIFETAIPQGAGFTGSGAYDGSPGAATAQTLTLTDYIPDIATMVDLHFYFQSSSTGTMFGFSYGDQDVTSATTMWNTAKLRASAPDTSGGQSARGFIPTIGATKRITYYRDAYTQSRIDVQGWIDGNLT